MPPEPTIPQSPGPTAAESFIADRQTFFHRFTSFTTVVVGILVVVLILMAIFLV